MATHSSILAWRTPRIEELGGLQSTGWQRVRHGWNDSARTHASRCILYCLPYMVCPTWVTNGQRSCSKTEAIWAFQRNEIDVGIRRNILLFPPGITSCRNVTWGTSGVPNGHLGYQLERMQEWGQLPENQVNTFIGDREGGGSIVGSGRGAQVEEERRNKRRRKRKGRKRRIRCPYRFLFCINYLELSFDLLLLKESD